MNRRQFAKGLGVSAVVPGLAPQRVLGIAVGASLVSFRSRAAPPGNRAGHLIIIGGAENREEDRVLLRRFVSLTGTDDPLVVVVTAASAHQDEVWEIYKLAFEDLGVAPGRLIGLEIASRADADNDDLASKIAEADGIFMTGGDQQRLMSVVGGTRTATAISKAFRRGACIGGTSAGAAVMSAHMMAEGMLTGPPGRGGARMSAGLGLLPGAIVDQHFSERQRLSRLLSLIAQAPFLLGVGIDENTALVIERGRGLEVIGEGAVTVIDGRHMVSNFFDVGTRELLEMLNIRMQLLPGGARYCRSEFEGTASERERAMQSAPVGKIPQALYDVVSVLTAV